MTDEFHFTSAAPAKQDKFLTAHFRRAELVAVYDPVEKLGRPSRRAAQIEILQPLQWGK